MVTDGSALADVSFGPFGPFGPFGVVGVVGHGRDERPYGDRVVGAEESCGGGCEEQRGSNEAQQRENPGYQPGRVQQGAQQQGVQHRHEGLSEEECPAIHGDQRLTRGQRRRGAAPERAGVRAGADDVIRTAHWPVQGEGRSVMVMVFSLFGLVR